MHGLTNRAIQCFVIDTRTGLNDGLNVRASPTPAFLIFSLC